MNLATKENLKLVGVPAALIAGALGLGVWLSPDAILPPPRTVTYYFTVAPGAAITDVWGSTNLTSWEHLGRVTNAPTGQQIIGHLAVPWKPVQFFRCSHPITNGHIWDTGSWRVNYKQWGLE